MRLPSALSVAVLPALLPFFESTDAMAWMQGFVVKGVLAVAMQSAFSSAYQPNKRPDSSTRPSESLKRRYKLRPDLEEIPQGLDLKRFGILSPSPLRTVSTVDELRKAVLDDKLPLKEIKLLAQEQSEILKDHDVLELMNTRFHSHSTPGNRADNSTLALAMEGGGMRGCVSAGMASAIACLGLTDTIDKVYGSSAGSVIGSYMVSRQMCIDVYVDILPAAKEKFVCKQRLVRSIASSLVDLMKAAMNIGTDGLRQSPKTPGPGMNISFVLDGIMGQDHGIRPLDLERFEENDKKQPLRVVSSCADSRGNMYSKCFGHEDFYGETAVQKVNKEREGLEACLEASMTVPGATGPPVEIWNATTGEVLPCFDAFCFEPIPYRSAVEEGATHVLALLSRPDGFEPKTKPGVYEQGVAPLYFHSHGQPKVAEFFEQGGQQYLYAEDLLLLEQGKTSNEKVLVPPAQILYGREETAETGPLMKERDSLWKRAHLLPVKVPRGTPELPTLENDKTAVLEAVRGGFSAAFDLLAPIVGLDTEVITGDEAAKLVFPSDSETEPQWEQAILGTKLRVPGFTISEAPRPMNRKKKVSTEIFSEDDSLALLTKLPGFQDGRFAHLGKSVLYQSNANQKTLQ